jgi:hypothetical protein
MCDLAVDLYASVCLLAFGGVFGCYYRFLAHMGLFE